MNQLSDRLAVWTVDHRWAPGLLILLISVIAGLGFYDPHLLPSLVESEPVAPASEPTKAPAPVVVIDEDSPLSLTDSDAIVVVQSPEFFTPQGAKALRQVVADLEALNYVDSVLWMDRVPILNIFGLPEPLFPRSEASPRRFEAAKQKALSHPLVVGQMLSEDAQTLMLMVTFDYLQLLTDEEATVELRQVAEASAEQFPDVDLTFQVTGSVPATIAVISSNEASQTTFQLMGFGMVGLMAVILFRGVRAVMIVALAPAIGVTWTIGMIRYVDYNENNGLIIIILPVLVALVAISDGVHLMVQIRKLRASGLSERDAARRGLQQVGMACFLTSFTTAIGLGSLMLANSEFVQEFGMCSVIGVLLSFLAVITIIPLACSTQLGRDIHIGLENSLVDRNLVRIGGLINWVLRHKKSLSVLSVGMTVGLFALCMTLEPDQRRVNELPAHAEATQALTALDQAMGGIELSRVEIHWPESVSADSPDVLLAVTEVDEYLKSEKLLGHPLSIRNLIDAQPGSGPPIERMSMLELLPPPLKSAFLSAKNRRAIVMFRVQDLGIAMYGPVFERLETALGGFAEKFPGFTFRLEGPAASRWRRLYQVVVDLAASLGTASIIIFMVLAGVYRSLRIGLISIIPNIFPLVFSGAWLAVYGYNLEIVMVCCFTVCLGIAVDDTIHFLTRFHEELEETPDTDEAIRRAFTGVGSALIMTTTVLVAGFSTVMFSDLRDHKIFATMGVLTIAAALFADLVFLPALLSWFAVKPEPKPS